MVPSESHAFEEHVGELRLRVEARSYDGIFVEAARALAGLLTGGGELPRPSDEREQVELQSRDRAALLVDWLNELVYRSEAHHRIYVDCQFDRLTDTGLRGFVRGAPVEELRTIVKAATLHGLELKEQADGYAAIIILDV
jgi:SHS2 domain-containing protein